MNDYKVINDPVFGFIKVPRGLLLDIVKHRLFQRLSRIKQLGMASVVYPGAQHTRFQHSLGAFHLMSEAILSLQQKGIFIFDSEAEALKAAILLHDVGHGPFSHVLEHTLISGISHEQISLMMMEEMNREMQGRLTLAIKIFKDDYPKRFLHQLISSQLDMDRLDSGAEALVYAPSVCARKFETGGMEVNKWNFPREIREDEWDLVIRNDAFNSGIGLDLLQLTANEQAAAAFDGTDERTWEQYYRSLDAVRAGVDAVRHVGVGKCFEESPDDLR